MGKLRVIYILLLIAAILPSLATANLISTSFGFPVISQSGTTTAFSQDSANAMDFESINIGFPMFGDLQGLQQDGFAPAPSSFSSMFSPKISLGPSLFSNAFKMPHML